MQPKAKPIVNHLRAQPVVRPMLADEQKETFVGAAERDLVMVQPGKEDAGQHESLVAAWRPGTVPNRPRATSRKRAGLLFEELELRLYVYCNVVEGRL